MADSPTRFYQLYQLWKLQILHMISLYNNLHEGNATESFARSILTLQCRPCKARIYSIITKLCSMGTVMDEKKFWKTYTDWRKTGWHQCSIRSKLKEIVMSFGSSVWIRKKYSLHWYEVSEVTALQPTAVHSPLPQHYKVITLRL
jgi:hypothetical protein